MSNYQRANEIYRAGLKKVKTTPPPKAQKYAPNTLVWIADDLGSFMQHFESGRPAMVEYTYAHAYGGNNVDSYSLLVRYDDGTWSSVAWYYENQLTEIKDKELIKLLRKEIK